MHRIALINCFFGNKRRDFEMWLKTCEKNESIDYLLFTDIEQMPELPHNVKVINISFEQLKQKVSEILNMKIKMDYYYKLCDFKVAYGYIFADYLKEYDFWGYCDIDLIFGDLRHFLTEDLLEKYEKIYYLGHLSLYKNKRINNEMFMNKENIIDYQQVFSQNKIFAFDETPGIYRTYKKEHIPMYEKEDFVDIAPMCKRRFMMCKYLKHKENRIQTFLWNNGKLFKVYYAGKVIFEEIAYIHFSGRQFDTISFNSSFFITNNGFKAWEKDLDLIDKKTILQMNKKGIKIIDKTECFINNMLVKIKKKIRKR